MTQEQAHEHEFLVSPPAVMTEPCFRFFRGHAELWDFIIYVTHLAIRADESAKRAAEALLILGEAQDDLDEGKREELRESTERGAGALKRLKDQRQLILQVWECRAVDNYLTYVSEMMALTFRSRPETLRSGETMQLDELLQHETMDDVVSMLAERRVDRLSYQGMRDLAGYLSENLGFILFEEEDRLENAVRIIELRNVIVHNRAVVNRRFLSRVPGSRDKLGERLELDPRPVCADVEFLAQSCSDIDGRAASKFDLPQPISRDRLIT